MKTNGYLLRLTAEFVGRFKANGEPHGEPHMCTFYYELSKREFVTAAPCNYSKPSFVLSN